MSGSLFSSVAQLPKTKSMETLSAWGCCLNSEQDPTWIGQRSPHSAGTGVLRTGSVPAFNNVVETSPANSVVKIPLGGSSAVECAFSIGGLEQWQTGAAIVGGFPSTAVWCKHDHIYRKRKSAIVHAFGNRSRLAFLLLGLGLGGTFLRWGMRCGVRVGSRLWSVWWEMDWLSVPHLQFVENCILLYKSLYCITFGKG